jgi:CSLREA domain-containing protein
MNNKKVEQLIVIVALSLGLIMALLVGLDGVKPAEVRAATFTVTKTADTSDGNCDADCSLREAIVAADNSAGADTITLGSGTFNLTLGSSEEIYDDPNTDDLDILNNPVTIIGQGPDATIIDAGGRHRIFDIAYGITVVISGVTIQNGDSGGVAAESGVYTGGGIYNQGNLTLINTVVISNNSNNSGGGIKNSGTLVIEKSRIVNNSSLDTPGAGIYNDDTLSLLDSTVSGNNTTDTGGGLYNSLNATALITNSTFSDNIAQIDGGAIYNADDTTLLLTNSTLSDNSATQGGAINNRGHLNLLNSTVADNTATAGGGIYNLDNGVIVGVVTMTNMIVANNTGGDCQEDAGAAPVAPPYGFSSAGHNLDSDGSCNLTGTGDLPNTAPLLFPLSDNGGDTQTHAIPTTSPAYNAGDNAVCPATDQRGVARPQEGSCDIGAYEKVLLPIIDATPLQFEFFAALGSTVPQTQSLLIDNIGDGGAAAFTWTVSTAGYDDWLEAAPPLTGTGPTFVDIIAATGGLTTPGLYTGQILVTEEKGGSSAVVPVTLTLSDSLSLTPQSLYFGATQGGSNPAAQGIALNLSSNTAWTAGDNATWLSLSPMAGTWPWTDTITVSPAISGLAAGTYYGEVAVNAPDAYYPTESVEVTLVVSPTNAASLPDVPVEIDEADHGKVFTITPGLYAEIGLRYTPSSGGRWSVISTTLGQGSDGNPIFRLAQESEIQGGGSGGSVGFSVLELFRFDPLQAGEAVVEFEYRGPDGQVDSTRPFSVVLRAVGSFEDWLTEGRPSPDDSLPPFTAPQDQLSGAAVGAQALPAALDWCDENGCTPIKHQGVCGSCWSFATNAVVESAILRRDNQTKNLSEQFLISCNPYGFSCAAGGWWAFDLFQNDISSIGSGPGAIYTTDYAYTGLDTACVAGASHHEQLASWSYVGDNALSIPPAEDIKRAIQEHGPVAAAVCVGTEFFKYKSGVFNTNEASACGGYSINHAIVLVGWNDVEGVWLLRNSWGTGWGESGYMRIAYGTSNIGYGAAYVVYEGTGGSVSPATAVNAPTELQAAADDAKAILTWTDNSDDETGFEIWRAIGNGSFTLVDTVDPNSTSYDDQGLTCNTGYSYQVRAIKGVDQSEFSNTANVTTLGCAQLAVPTGFVAQGFVDKIELSWVDTNTTEDGYEIWRWNPDTQQWELIGEVGSNVTQYTDTAGLEHGPAYYYQIRAIEGANESNFSDTTASARLTKNLINAPSNLTPAEAPSGQVALTWADNSNNESGFIIERWNPQLNVWAEVGTTLTDTESYMDVTTQCHATYSYQVIATDGNGSYSNYSNLATLSTCITKVYLPLIMK